MEYSVYDLIRILLKKWYIIVLCALLVGSGAIGLSWLSYQDAIDNYEELTTQTVPVIVNTGTTTASYQYTYSGQEELISTVLSLYQQTAQMEMFVVPEAKTLVDLAFADAKPNIDASVTSLELLAKVQKAVDQLSLYEPPTINADKVVTPSAGPLQVAAHLSVALRNGTIHMTVTGLEEEVAKTVLDAYCRTFSEVNANLIFTTALEAIDLSFAPDPLQPTAMALLAQEIMAEPPTAPGVVKVAGTGACFGFAVGCFIVLLVTFIKDTRPNKKEKPSNEEYYEI